ncbi:hypothetical protein IW140_003093 [Coemansia sp. RSA 1813]|nr:hypothetical protein LPJ74_004214 [Coemansia sp. RSA 1843]KAJ2089522.1 hypothetical protein IW138_003411 [Coemansia sp. RSA 986]KAJ2214508.1 hypothetical protein EV179_002913 [Coemansia sp. RSA 487]KAJ2569390.1 hypothetical protein IW140_003093 [Coemansia sp. RSA 1813]
MKLFYAGILTFTLAAFTISAAPAGEVSSKLSHKESRGVANSEHPYGFPSAGGFSDCSDSGSDWDNYDASDEHSMFHHEWSDGESHSGEHRRRRGRGCHPHMSGFSHDEHFGDDGLVPSEILTDSAA